MLSVLDLFDPDEGWADEYYPPQDHEEFVDLGRNTVHVARARTTYTCGKCGRTISKGTIYAFIPVGHRSGARCLVCATDEGHLAKEIKK